MRLLKEIYLRELLVGDKFMVDGAWYVVKSTEVVEQDTRIMVELESEFYATQEEYDEDMPLIEIGDVVKYRADLIVITEVN
jgi:hypothetical protein